MDEWDSTCPGCRGPGVEDSVVSVKFPPWWLLNCKKCEDLFPSRKRHHVEALRTYLKRHRRTTND